MQVYKFPYPDKFLPKKCVNNPLIYIFILYLCAIQCFETQYMLFDQR